MTLLENFLFCYITKQRYSYPMYEYCSAYGNYYFDLLKPLSTYKEPVQAYLIHTYRLKFSGRKQRFLSSPAQSWTPTIPKMKKTKKQRRRTFPNIGSVSKSRVTRMRIPKKANKSLILG